MQRLPHGEKGLLHAKLQLPSKQMPLPLAGELQVAPQPPQFLEFELMSAQALPQAVSLAAQVRGPGRLLGLSLVPGRTQSWVAVSQT